MPPTAFLVPGSIDALTGGSIYDRRIVEGLRSRGSRIEVHVLDAGFPEPTAAALAAAASTLAGIDDGAVVIVDGLAFGAMPGVVELEHERLKFVALVHMPLALEVGIDHATARRRADDERRALNCARAVVVTGPAVPELLARMVGFRSAGVSIVEPGCDRAPVARGSEGPVPNILCVAPVVVGKGHDGLVRALKSVKTDWTLTCVGSLTRDEGSTDKLRRLIEDVGLVGQISFTGELDGHGLAAAYDRADLFILNTKFETYGMAVAQALARGIPVVSTRTGAIPDLVGADAGMLVEVDDESGLAAVCSALLLDPALRRRCREGALQVRERLAPWDDAVRKFADVVDRVAADD